MKKLNLFLRNSFIIITLVSCTTLPWNRGELAVTQLKSEIPGNLALDKLKNEPEINKVIKLYGYPKTLKLTSEDQSLILYYPKNNQFISFYLTDYGWTRETKLESDNKYLEVYKINLSKECTLKELAQVYTGDIKNEKRLKIVNKNLNCVPDETFNLPKYLASTEIQEKLSNSNSKNFLQSLLN